MVGFTYNEVSRRYVDDTPEFYVPDVWRGRAENKKQGSSDVEITTLYDNDGQWSLNDDYHRILDEVLTVYDAMIRCGVAPEQARMILPQSMYTSYYVTGSLAAWARAYKQRIDSHAQKEIQDLAKMWGSVISGIPEMEWSWKALTSG